ncbi:MAG: type II toxin-antitoxin system RelE/ParE family toxin [Silvanigrellales bacterium]|jgi:putative addiction module killer protein|nr:type II toxin-antitoxin system RelE/ParE family toxin [Silvanigrellales bacterium]
METEVVAYQEEGELDALTAFLRELRDKNDIVKIRKLVRFLQTQGRDLGFPLSKALGEGLHELRDRSCGFRVYYMFFNDQIAVLLIGGDKSTQETDIERARNRRTRLLRG